jgi:antitoxin YefM
LFVRRFCAVHERLVPETGTIGVMAISASEARRNLFPLIEQVNSDHEPVEIVSRAGSAILLSADDFRALEETAYLLRSPANARRLLDAMDAVRRGDVVAYELDRD